MTFFGVDGCRAGWFYFCLSGSKPPHYGMVRNAAELVAVALDRQAQLVLIDIPIGLRDVGSAERLCDKESRRILGRPRGSSVFRAPVRQALEASSYADACARNFVVTGKRLSQQGYQICKKIREIDQLLMARAEVRSVFREMHPEVCSWALNGGQATRYSKKRSAGRRERIEVLAKWLPDAQSVIDQAAAAYRRKDVGVDDILDALAGAVTAWIGHERLKTLPDVPEKDAQGLAMEMVFCAPLPGPPPADAGGGKR